MGRSLVSGLAVLPPTSLVLACDMPAEQLSSIVRATHRVPKVRTYKIGAALALELGLRTAVDQIRAAAEDAVVIYDHQKAGTDIPDTAKGFMATLSRAGVDAVILFPLSGPVTQKAWITEAQEHGLDVIVGGYMTHDEFLRSEGGYIDDDAVERLFRLAGDSGVRHFVVPGNHPDAIAKIRSYVDIEDGSVGLWAPGFVTQGGKLTEAARVAGPRFHAIVGRQIFRDPDPETAARQMSSEL